MRYYAAAEGLAKTHCLFGYGILQGLFDTEDQVIIDENGVKTTFVRVFRGLDVSDYFFSILETAGVRVIRREKAAGDEEIDAVSRATHRPVELGRGAVKWW